MPEGWGQDGARGLGARRCPGVGGKTVPGGWGQDGPGPSCPQPPIRCIVIFGDNVCACSFHVLMVIKHVEIIYDALNIIACQASNMAVLLFSL